MNRVIAAYVAALLWTLLWSLPAPAQGIDADKQAQVAPLSSADGKSSAASSLSVISLAAATTDSKATLSLAGFTPKPFYGDYSLLQIGGEAPVSKGSDSETDIGTVSGLTAGASANASASVYWWPHEQLNVTIARDTICKDEFPKLIAGGFRYEDGPQSHADTACKSDLFDTKQLQSIADGFNDTIKQCKKFAAQHKTPPTKLTFDKNNKPIATAVDCQKFKDRLFWNASLTDKAKDPSYLEALQAKVDAVESGSANKLVKVLTFGTKANRQKVAYFNKTDLTTLIKDHSTGYGVNLAGSSVWPMWMLSGGFSYEKTFKNVDSVQICSPVSAGSTSSKCLTGTIGPPPGMYARILFAESRILISVGALAVAPRLEYDFTAAKFAAKLPLYFAPDKNKALIGGITLGYVTHGDGFGVEVFVGKAFSFY
jgi:hypothetical protein